MVLDRAMRKQMAKIQGILKELLFILIFLIISSTRLYAQENNDNIRFSGSANLSDNFYSSNGIDPRQPPNLFV